MTGCMRCWHDITPWMVDVCNHRMPHQTHNPHVHGTIVGKDYYFMPICKPVVRLWYFHVTHLVDKPPVEQNPLGLYNIVMAALADNMSASVISHGCEVSLEQKASHQWAQVEWLLVAIILILMTRTTVLGFIRGSWCSDTFFKINLSLEDKSWRI